MFPMLSKVTNPLANRLAKKRKDYWLTPAYRLQKSLNNASLRIITILLLCLNELSEFHPKNMQNLFVPGFYEPLHPEIPFAFITLLNHS